MSAKPLQRLMMRRYSETRTAVPSHHTIHHAAPKAGDTSKSCQLLFISMTLETHAADSQRHMHIGSRKPTTTPLTHFVILIEGS